MRHYYNLQYKTLSYLAEFQRVAFIVRTGENTITAILKEKKTKQLAVIIELNFDGHIKQKDMNERTHLDRL